MTSLTGEFAVTVLWLYHRANQPDSPGEKGFQTVFFFFLVGGGPSDKTIQHQGFTSCAFPAVVSSICPSHNLTSLSFVCLSLSVSVSLSLSLSLYLCLSVYVSLCLSVSVSLSLYLSVSVSLSFTRGGCASCLRACLDAMLLPQSYQYPNLSEGAGSVCGQLRGDKKCPVSGVTSSGRVWR